MAAQPASAGQQHRSTGAPRTPGTALHADRNRNEHLKVPGAEADDAEGEGPARWSPRRAATSL